MDLKDVYKAEVTNYLLHINNNKGYMKCQCNFLPSSQYLKKYKKSICACEQYKELQPQ